MSISENRRMIRDLEDAEVIDQETADGLRVVARILSDGLREARRRFKFRGQDTASLWDCIICWGSNRHDPEMISGEFPRSVTGGILTVKRCSRCSSAIRVVRDINLCVQSSKYDHSPTYQIVMERLDRDEARRLIEETTLTQFLRDAGEAINRKNGSRRGQNIVAFPVGRRARAS